MSAVTRKPRKDSSEGVKNETLSLLAEEALMAVSSIMAIALLGITQVGKREATTSKAADMRLQAWGPGERQDLGHKWELLVAMAAGGIFFTRSIPSPMCQHATKGPGSD